MAAHYEEAHGAEIRGRPCSAKVLDDGSKVVQYILTYSFSDNGEGWIDCCGLDLNVFRTAVGGCFALDLRKVGPRELRFGVRQLGRGPPRHRLASVMVRFGPVDDTCFQYRLSRALAADERLGDDALCAGTPPAVGRVDPEFLRTALVLRPGLPGKPWRLAITLSLVFQVGRDAPL